MQREPTISVIVYALNDASTLKWCLDSLVEQESGCDFEVIVIDDCSTDATSHIVDASFPHFELVRQDRARGWVACVRDALPRLRGEIVAFLGAHCSADRRWLESTKEAMSSGCEAVTGRGTHGRQGFLARFEAMSVHGDYVGHEAGEVRYVWDDNFAILPYLLERALPRQSRLLSDGAGAVLLSLELQRQGIAIHYCPSMQIDHITHSMIAIFRLWNGELARNAVDIKLADPSLPAARLLWLGPVAAGALAVSRFLQGVRNVFRVRHAMHVSLPEAVLHCCLLACLAPAHFLGLCREIWLNRDHITRRA